MLLVHLSLIGGSPNIGAFVTMTWYSDHLVRFHIKHIWDCKSFILLFSGIFIFFKCDMWSLAAQVSQRAAQFIREVSEGCCWFDFDLQVSILWYWLWPTSLSSMYFNYGYFGISSSSMAFLMFLKCFSSPFQNPKGGSP